MILQYVAVLIATLATTSGQVNAQESGLTIKPLSRQLAPPNLPIHVIDSKATQGTLAILYSGDGGWQEIDDEIARHLRNAGIPVVGLDSLRYFWSGRTAQRTAADLGVLIDYYTRRLTVRRVLLIGYSFGADVMPASYNRLSTGQKAKVKAISLLSLSHKVDYQVSLAGWLGFQTEGKGGNPINDLKSINPEMVQCIYGQDDSHDNACPAVRGTGITVISMPGGHHFGGDYEKLAQHIIASIKARPNK